MVVTVVAEAVLVVVLDVVTGDGVTVEVAVLTKLGVGHSTSLLPSIQGTSLYRQKRAAEGRCRRQQVESCNHSTLNGASIDGLDW